MTTEQTTCPRCNEDRLFCQCPDQEAAPAPAALVDCMVCGKEVRGAVWGQMMCASCASKGPVATCAGENDVERLKAVRPGGYGEPAKDLDAVATEGEPALEDELAPTGDVWPVKLQPDDIAAIVEQLAARLEAGATPKPLTASLHVGRKLSDGDYGSYEATAHISGVTAATTEDELDALVSGPAALGWKKIVVALNERMHDAELKHAGKLADPRTAGRK